MDPLITELIRSGPVGLALGIVLWLYVRRDRQLSEETRARIKDAQDFAEKALALQKQVLDAVETLKDILREFQRRRGV